MRNTGYAETLLQFKTLKIICRTCSDVWKHGERIQTVLACPDENVTTGEIPGIYNAQHTWELSFSVFLKQYEILESRLVLLALFQWEMTFYWYASKQELLKNA